MPSKKSLVIEELFKICLRKNDFIFHNNLVKEVSKTHEFGNPFDATKLDKKTKIPKLLLDMDYTVIHLGNGYHKFVQGIDKVFHNFEPILETINWNYRKSLLNMYNASESNILSVANNQRILHHFLFNQDTEFDDIDITKRPKTYFPHRTKTSFEYNFGNCTSIVCKNLQIEIDVTIEYQGTVCVFEGKKGKINNFNIFQIYHPFLYYYTTSKSKNLNEIKKIVCVYVVHQKNKGNNKIFLWLYTFENPFDVKSITLLKSTEYNLIMDT